MSAIDAWRETERAMASQDLTLHNLGGDIWEVADQMLAAIAELEARTESLYERRLPCREAEVAQARYEQAEAELAALNARRCETCADRDGRAVDEPCDRFSDSFLAFMRDHCKGKPVSCCFWAERETP